MYEKVGFGWEFGFVVVGCRCGCGGCCWLSLWLLVLLVLLLLLVVAQFRNIQVSFFYSFTPRSLSPFVLPKSILGNFATISRPFDPTVC